MARNNCIDLAELRGWMHTKAVVASNRQNNHYDMKQWEQEQQDYYDSLSVPESNLLHDVLASAKQILGKLLHGVRGCL